MVDWAFFSDCRAEVRVEELTDILFYKLKRWESVFFVLGRLFQITSTSTWKFVNFKNAAA